MTRLTRRDFIKTASLMGGVSLFAGCSFFGDAPRVPEYIKGAPGVDPIESLQGIKNLYSVCALCDGKCGICCRTTEGSVVKIGGNPYHPISSGAPLSIDTPIENASRVGASICAIGSSGIQTLYDPFRVARPLKRVGPRGSGKWKAVSWSEAISEILGGGNLFGEGAVPGLTELKNSKQGLGFVLGNADWGASTFVKGFLSSFPGAMLFRDEAVLSGESVRAANISVFGKAFGAVDANYRKARLLVSFGSAPLDSGVPLVSIAREIAISRVSSPNLKWVVIDPRQSTSGAKADLWLPVIPGKDLSLAMAVMKALFERFSNAVKFSNDSIKNAIKDRSISDYANDAGSYEGAAVEIARYLAEAGPGAAVIPGAGIYNQQNGKEVAQAILTLNLIVGSSPGIGGLTYSDDSYFAETEKSILGLTDVSGAGTLQPCQALMVWGSDPVCESPKLADVFSQPRNVPLVVAIGSVISETAALADFILPDTTYLERWDICSAPSMISNTGFGLRSPVIGGMDSRSGRYFPILPETMLMEDILFRFSESLNLGFCKEFAVKDSPGIARSFYHNAASRLFQSYRKLYPAKKSVGITVEAMFERGGYFEESETIKTLENKETAYKVDPSAWGKITGPAVSTDSELLTLITYTLPFHRPSLSCVNPWLLETLPENRLVINPLDASARRLKQGDLVTLERSDGLLKKTVRTQIAPGIRPGVVALASGFGYKGAGSATYSIDQNVKKADKTRSAGISAVEFKEKGSLVRIRKG